MEGSLPLGYLLGTASQRLLPGLVSHNKLAGAAVPRTEAKP
jgi:hypothetical protein